MRYVTMQFLTWGTIAGAIGSALILAALDGPPEAQLATLPRAELFMLPNEPTGAGPTEHEARRQPRAAGRAPADAAVPMQR